MGYLDFLAQTPYAWITLSGVFVGGAISRILTPVSVQTDRARSLKWARVYASLALGVVAATLAVFVPDPGLIFDLGLAYQFAGAVVVSAAAMRFKLAAGIPVFLLLVVAVSVTLVARQVYRPYRPPEPVAVIRVLSRGTDSATIELIPSEDASAQATDARILDVGGGGMAVRASTVELSPHLFFIGMRYGYRLKAVITSTELSLPGPTGVEAALFGRLSDHAEEVPGVDVDDVSSNAVRPVVLRRYRVVFVAARRLEIQEVRG